MRTALVHFTRDLRVHDHPALSAAVGEAECVVPVFVLDPILLRDTPAARIRFLLEALADLDDALSGLGAPLVIRHGDPASEVADLAAGVGAEAVFASEDVTTYAQRREGRLREMLVGRRIDLRAFPGVTVVPPGDLVPTGGHVAFRVFTPYWRRWRLAPRRAVLSRPRVIRPLGSVDPGSVPAALRSLADSAPPGRFAGGARTGRARLDAWIANGLAGYEAARDDLLSPGTSLLSPYLHLGCVSPLDVVERAAALRGADGFVRQLCWRDFHHQLHASDPSLANRELRSRGDAWLDDADAASAWREGATGYPVVDAAMRQLAAEGFIPNRARMIVASFLAKHLYVDWRIGAAHFMQHLVDGDVANNTGNWQWVAGIGADTRPNRMLNPIRQARRFDPDGAYVRRWVPELAAIDGAAIHEPWSLRNRPSRYPAPIVAHDEAVLRFRRARRLDR